MADVDGRVGEILLTRNALAERIDQLGKEISLHYGPSPVIAVGVLKGAIFFLADLLRRIDGPVELSLVRASSYAGTAPAGPPRLDIDPTPELRGAHVLIVEDIVDTGATLDVLQRTILERKPLSLRTCALLDKPDRRRVEVHCDWVGFRIPDRFVVGYGLDLDGRYRNLPDVHALR